MRGGVIMPWRLKLSTTWFARDCRSAGARRIHREALREETQQGSQVAEILEA